ncbi:MAG TPA: CoA transferase [Candidatus Binataceae bacterium]|nr:CoA transferase [Candidatus Binataceae bacterium]
MDRPLEGIKVVELAMWVAGPSCAAAMADWGAEVIKLEDPNGGDPVRGTLSKMMGGTAFPISPPFEMENRNKRSVAVDLRNPEGHAFALKVIERADVFVTSLRLDAIKRMKLDYETLKARNPRLIYATLNGYGHRGPDRNRPAYDYAAGWARSGLMATIGEPGQPPPAQRPAMIDHPVGLSLAGAISAALFQREKTGRGCEVRTSLFAMGLWMNSVDLTMGLILGLTPSAEARNTRINPLWSSYKCKDGRWIYFVMIQSDRFWPAFCSALEQPGWREDERFKNAPARAVNCQAMTAEIDRVMATKTADEWAPSFDKHDLIWTYVASPAEVLKDPQAEAIGAFPKAENPNWPNCKVVNSPIEFGDGPPGPHRAAPELGQHTEEVALEVGLSWEDIAKLKESGALG